MLRERRPDGTTVLSGANPGLAAYPVGAVYISVANTSPASLFGGTWSRFGQGRVLVGLNESDTSFDTVEETGGVKEESMSLAQMPQHVHWETVGYDGTGLYTFQVAPAGSKLTRVISVLRGLAAVTQSGSAANGRQDSTSEAVTYSGAPTPTAVSKLQPYITVFMWKRTA